MRKLLSLLLLCLLLNACNLGSDKRAEVLNNTSSQKVAMSNKEMALARMRFDSLWELGLQNKWVGEPDKYLNNFTECLSIARLLNNDSLFARVYISMSGYYDDLGEYNMEVEILNKALENFDAIHNDVGSAVAYNNLAWAYIQAFDYKKGIEHARKGISYIEKFKDDTTIGRNSCLLYSTLALGFLEEHQSDSALKYTQLAYEFFPFVKRGKLNQYCWLFSTFGNIYAQKKEYEKAENSYKTVMAYKDTSVSADAAVFTIGKYCQLLNTLNRCREAIAVGRDGIRIAVKTGLVRYQIDIADAMRVSFEKLKMTDSAYAYSKIATALRDSVFNARKSIQLQSMTFNRDMKAKELKFEIEKAKAEEQLQGAQRLKNMYLLGFVLVMIIAVLFFYQRNKIRAGKVRSDELLLNILPEEVAEELKSKGKTDARYYDEVTIMFTDFKNFTQIAERLSPQELVSEIDTCFKAFDTIIEKYNIEKIKTIGDAYMCAGGLPVSNKTHAADVVNAALEIQAFISNHAAQNKAEGKEIFEIRIGIHTGPIVAGIVGIKKFAYDIWGDTVNIASRMESSGETGKINISGTTYALLKDKFMCTYRGKINVKNKENLDMYFVDSVL